MKRMIRGDSYNYHPCEHKRDPITCEYCDIFDDGVGFVDETGIWAKLKDPIGYWKIKRHLKRYGKK